MSARCKWSYDLSSHSRSPILAGRCRRILVSASLSPAARGAPGVAPPLLSGLLGYGLHERQDLPAEPIVLGVDAGDLGHVVVPREPDEGRALAAAYAQSSGELVIVGRNPRRVEFRRNDQQRQLRSTDVRAGLPLDLFGRI